MKNAPKTKSLKVLIPSIAFVAGIFLAFIFVRLVPQAFQTGSVFSSVSSVGCAIGLCPQPLTVPIEYRINTTPQYKLINPLIFIDTDQGFFTEYDTYDKAVSSFVDTAEKSNQASSVSVYFRDLNSGHWTGTNENEVFNPSSMLKVAVLIAYLKGAMQDKQLLSKKLYYPGQDWTGQYYVQDSGLQKGDYTIQQLINAMIIDSDNQALNVLESNDPSDFSSTYQDFKLPAYQDAGEDFMTTKSFSVVFRSLYNASYVLRSQSEQALELLSQTTFTKGIVAGTPGGITIAHKFGEHSFVNANGTLVDRELHDCGIVYYPGDPYLLCVMTKGKDFSSLESVISGVAKISYDWTDTRMKMAK